MRGRLFLMYKWRMWSRKLFLVCVTAIVLFFSCATRPSFDPSIPLLSIEKADAAVLSMFGSTFETNPYLEPKTLLRGKLNEFFVVKISFNLPKDSEVLITAEAVDKDGRDAASAYDRYALKDFWEFAANFETDNPKFQKKMIALEKSCIPGYSFHQKAGKAEYYMPFVGKNPLPRPSSFSIRVALASGESATYEFLLE